MQMGGVVNLSAKQQVIARNTVKEIPATLFIELRLTIEHGR